MLIFTKNVNFIQEVILESANLVRETTSQLAFEKWSWVVFSDVICIDIDSNVVDSKEGSNTHSEALDWKRSKNHEYRKQEIYDYTFLIVKVSNKKPKTLQIPTQMI